MSWNIFFNVFTNIFAFFPVIYLVFYKKWPIQGIIIFNCMVISILYHMCKTDLINIFVVDVLHIMDVVCSDLVIAVTFTDIFYRDRIILKFFLLFEFILIDIYVLAVSLFPLNYRLWLFFIFFIPLIVYIPRQLIQIAKKCNLYGTSIRPQIADVVIVSVDQNPEIDIEIDNLLTISDKKNNEDPPEYNHMARVNTRWYNPFIKFRYLLCAIICNTIQIPFYMYIPEYDVEYNISHGCHHILGFLSVFFYYNAIDEIY